MGIKLPRIRIKKKRTSAILKRLHKAFSQRGTKKRVARASFKSQLDSQFPASKKKVVMKQVDVLGRSKK